MPVKKSGDMLNKLEAKFRYGILLCASAGNVESIVGPVEGVFRSRLVRRLAADNDGVQVLPRPFEARRGIQ